MKKSAPLQKSQKKLLSEVSPIVYFVRIWQKRIIRFIYLFFHKKTYSLDFSKEQLTYRCTRHNSKLIRNYLTDDPLYMKWQRNKIVNLKLAIEKINNCIIKPGQTFSFWYMIGRPTEKKGFLEGMEISRGKARAGIGGGICQLSNLLNWMAWHTPLTVVERSLHSYDPFPDQGRVLPFGSGAAVFWNYVDWQVTNTTPHTFQFRVFIASGRLKGEIRCSAHPMQTFSVFEKNHFFKRQGDEWYRSNEIWVSVFEKGIDGKIPKHLHDKLLVKNWSKVCYEPDSTRYKIFA
ncbi:vancomycin B-type resistance protein VanW [Holospora undulata HU1]|uniref:Vancomycin B-type resistance protein VanW n=3 Tax=Holospora TaxID=44747 RepID=A0A061JGR8_9PROT|nr:vancomycin B-type resistance protein VanW [Holospora undulata HU1]